MKTVVSNKAFTIVELLVAMALVVILVALSSLIFATGVKASRTADSTVEIVRRAESVSLQLANDVGRLRTDAPLAVWFERAQVDTDGDNIPDSYKRFDQILFFANGDFQTMRQYNGLPVSSHLARIQYGHAWHVQMDAAGNPVAKISDFLQSGLLSRRVHLLTSDLTLSYYGVPLPFPVDMTNPAQFAVTFTPYANNRSEYDQLSLSEWKYLMENWLNCNHLLLTCFLNDSGIITNIGRPMMDMKETETLHLLLSENISEFKVQWAYTVANLSSDAASYAPIPSASVDYFAGVRWWPSDNPAGDGTVIPDFITMANSFGAYFNMPGGTTYPTWYRVKPQPAETSAQQAVQRCRTQGQSGTQYYFSSDYFPPALRFTFTVYDTKGLYPEGKTFTQIVYINN